MDRVMSEQRECAEYLSGDGTDKSGARAGLADWIAEECAVSGEYEDFLDGKGQLGGRSGFEPVYIPGFLYDFQQSLVDWAMQKGKAAIFADCGLGKTPMQLVWAENIVRKTGKNVLIITPLAVGAQTVRDGTAKFGIECSKATEGRVTAGISITNYERLHLFNSDDYAGVVLDESSILKSFDGARRSKNWLDFTTLILSADGLHARDPR